jgi:RimJ/RimL family protein N-acetyltransferase
MNKPLFEGEIVRLAAIEPEKDAETEAKWTNDPEYLRMVQMEPARPLSPKQIRKRYEDAEKEKNSFAFAIRTRADDRMIGYVRLQWIEWTNSTGHLTIGIGDTADRGRGYGAEALRLVLRYAFAELNLFRLTAVVPEYNSNAIRFFERAGFCTEARRRQAVQREGRRWDVLVMGLLRNEWEGAER